MAFSAPNDDIERMRPPEGTALSFTASAAITAGQVVYVSGDNTVAPSSTDGEAVVGIAAQTVASGEEVMVIGSGGRVLFTSGSGGVRAGDVLASHGATGDPGQVDTAGTGDYIVGYTLEADGGSQGTTCVGVVDISGQVN